MEIWKDCNGYIGLYQASNIGRVRSIDRIVYRNNYPIKLKGKILKYYLQDGYEYYHICKNGISKSISGHRLVSFAFLNHSEENKLLVVNHKNFIRNDNRLENLELITQRENTNQKHLKSSSKYVGVRYMKRTKRWYAYITIKNKKHHLGSYVKEIDAHKAYQKKLKEIKSI